MVWEIGKDTYFRQYSWYLEDRTHHIPGKVRQPIKYRFDTADKLKMFGFAGTFLNQEKDKTGRHKGHGEDYTDRDQNVNWCGHPEKKRSVLIYMSPTDHWF